jgi:hypothetical protein
MKFKVSKTRKYALVASFSLVLLAELADLNLPETMALSWHLRHGFKAQCCGVQFDVPLRYSVLEEPRSLSLFGGVGHVRFKLFHSPISTISVDAQDDDYDQSHTNEGRKRLIAAYERAGNRLVGSKTIQVAGKPFECSELYIDHSDVFGPQNTVFCSGKGTLILFSGSPALLNEFYSILQGAKATR